MTSKKELNQNIKIGEGNDVLRDTEDAGFLIFSILQGVTCVYATKECLRKCYGRNAQELFTCAFNSRKRNLEETKKETFVEDMITIINYNLTRKKYKGKHIYFRWHETGDLYTQEYTDKVFAICNHFKGNDRITFQLYTKSLPLLEKYDLSNVNAKILFSVMIDTPTEQIDIAKKLGLQTFEALPSRLYEQVNDGFKCKGDCGNCKVCYQQTQNEIERIYVEYHGARAVGSRNAGRKEREKKLYWK